MSLGINLIFFIFALSGAAHLVNGALETVPENDAVLAGSTVVLHCSARAGAVARVMWTEFVVNDAGMVVSDNRNILPSHPKAARFSILGTGLDFHLQISNVTVADGGKYLCQDINGSPPDVFRGSAELIVLQSHPECTYIASVTGVVVEERIYTKECEVEYQGFFPPNMTWSGPGTYSTADSVTDSRVWSGVAFSATRDMEGGRFRSHTRFVLPPGRQFLADEATNTPDYEHTFEGTVLVVNWGPSSMDVNPRKDSYVTGDVLTCTADSKPAARMVWTNMRTLVSEDPGATFTVRQELEGTQQTMRCNANLNIEGSLYTNDVFVNVSVPAITTPTTPSTAPTTTPPPADGPCDDLTGRWSSTNPTVQLCIEMDHKGNLLTLLRNGTDLYLVPGNGKTVYGDYRHVGFSAIWPPGQGGVAGFSGECHKCYGDEVLLMSGLARDKVLSPGCGQSDGTRLTRLYVLTRFGPPCRDLDMDVYRPSEAHIKAMRIPAKHIIT